MDHAERPVSSGDPAVLALATVDRAFPDESDAQRAALRSALEAAAVPHCCDAAVLTALVDDSGLLGPGLWDRVRTLPVIEGFPARAGAGGCVAEISRLALRKRLAQTQRARFLAGGPGGHLRPARRSGPGTRRPRRGAARLDPDNAGWRRELAEARRRTGG